MFSVTSTEYAAGVHRRSSSDIGIPPAFSRLYGLDCPESENGPYAVAVRTLLTMLPAECKTQNHVTFLLFQGNMQPAFRELLAQKNAHALLLLEYWYAKVCRAVWWVERRATLECQAICLYLEWYHGGDADIQKLLHYPRRQCGMLREDDLHYETGLAVDGPRTTWPVYS